MTNAAQLISIYSVLLPLIVGALLYKYLDSDSKIVLLVVFLAAFPQIIGGNKLVNENAKNLLYNSYTLAEILLYVWLFYRYLYSTLSKYIIIAAGVICVACCFWFKGFDFTAAFYTLWVIMANMFYLVMMLMVIYESNKSENHIFLQHKPLAWFMTGLLFYTPTTFGLFLKYDFLSPAATDDSGYLWVIHNFLNTLMYLLFAWGMYINYRNYKFPITDEDAY